MSESQLKSKEYTGKWCEIELSKGKRKLFLHVQFEPKHFFIDVTSLGPTALLCGACDGVPMYEASCGATGKIKRLFVSLDWACDEWGGPKEVEEALKKRREMLNEEYPNLYEKYMKDGESEYNFQFISE